MLPAPQRSHESYGDSLSVGVSVVFHRLTSEEAFIYVSVVLAICFVVCTHTLSYSLFPQYTSIQPITVSLELLKKMDISQQ